RVRQGARSLARVPERILTGDVAGADRDAPLSERAARRTRALAQAVRDRDARTRRGAWRAAAVREPRGGAQAARDAGPGDAAGGDSLLRRRDDAGRGRGRDRPIDPDGAQAARERDGAARTRSSN